MFLSLFKPKTKQNIQIISVFELHNQLEEGQAIHLIDVRSPNEYATGHIQGARLLPLHNLEHRLNELPHDTPIVCVCLSGARSAVASEILTKAGFSTVLNLSGGMTSWFKHGYQVAR